MLREDRRSIWAWLHFPCCTDDTRRPGMQARRSVASLAALPAVCDGRRDDARAASAELFSPMVAPRRAPTPSEDRFLPPPARSQD
jgi:hypothetical protein